MKVNFTISGDVLNENETGLEAILHIFGYENDLGYLATDDKGKFILKISNIPFSDFLFRKLLLINPKVKEMEWGAGVSYYFRVKRNQHIKLKIYPFSKRVIEVI